MCEMFNVLYESTAVKVSLVLTMQVWTRNTISKFYPGKDGSATTLDAICGLKHTSDPIVNKPSIKLYLQRSDTTDQNVIVLVMENYLSDAYLDEREEDVNKMKFQQHNSTQSHIRVYHDSRGLRVEEGDEVGIVFGNTKASSKLVRATGEGTVLEDHHMKMSNQIFQWEKETYEEVVGMLSEAYTRRVDVAYNEESMGSSGPCKSRQNNVGKSRTFDDGTNSGCKERYEPMCGSQDIDTCVIQIGTSPYEHHADNGDDICDNDSFETSHEAMPVITHCMTFKANTSKKKGTSNKSQTIDVTIRHGVPDDTPKGTSHKMCSILGHFCGGKTIKWKTWNQKNCQGIPMGGRSHAHMQGRGAQLRLHHWITSKSSSIRVVSSGRSTLPFQNSKEKRKALLENVGRDDDPSRHNRSQILDIYTGKRRVIIPVPSPLISKGARVPPKNKRPKPSPDDGVKTKSKRRRIAQQKQMSSKTSAIDFMPTRHSNTEDVLDSEQFNRRTVVGMSNSIRKEGIFRSLVSVRQLCDAKVSANLHRNDEDDRVFVGPSLVEVCDAHGSVILDNVGNPKYENMLLGQRVCSKELDASCGINNNSHNSDVVNESKMDTVNLKRLTKNSASVARNLVAILKHSEGRDQGNDSESSADWSELEPMIIRGHGGVFTNAGVNAPRTSADTTVRESPMHILPSGQDLTGSNAQAWRKSLRVKQCMNVYFQGYYLGLYYVTRIVEEERTLEDVRAEVTRLNEHLPFLHNVDSKTFPKHIETDISDKSNSHYHEMLGMLGMTQYITLTPVEKNVTKGMQRNEWRLIDISCDDVIKPTVHINNNALKSETENPTCGAKSAGKEPLLNWSSLIEPVEGCSPLLHLSDEKRRECLNAKELKNPTLQEHGRAILGMPSHNGKGRTLEEAVNAALHASGTITAKSTSKEAVYWDEKELKLKSPRYLFGEQESQEYYCEALKKTRLKSLLMTPVHSPFISTEVSAMLAVACTQSNEESLREIDGQSKKWLNRNGPEYCLNEETSNEAWQIMFTAIVCQLFTPSVFIELLEEVYEVDATTSPVHRRVDATAIIERFKQRDTKAWKSSLVHKNLRKTFENKREAFIEFLDWLALNGKNAIRHAISKSDSLDREKVMTDMARIFTKESHIRFNEFSIQILARCIECCIHEPFGEVKSVPSGYGGKEASACFADAVNAHHENITAPEWLVLEMNARARRILVDRQPQTNDVTEDQLKLELTVMGLEWSTELDCLVHKYGIGKKLDSSDTEHLLCLINRMLQRTLPSMNTSETHQHDTDWCLPVAYWKKGTRVIDMPFMSELVKESEAILKAYRDLLDDDTYIHRALCEIYIVDMYSD